MSGKNGRRAGRKPLIDEMVYRELDGKRTRMKRRDLIIAALRNGSMLSTAFEYAGIKKGTGDAILRRARIQRDAGMTDAPLVQFLESVESARSEARLRMEAVVFTAGVQGAKWALEWLKRNYTEDWGDVLTVRREEVREAALRMARENDLDEAEVLAEAERIYARGA